MRNKRIVDSWNKIEPDSAADARMLGAILARNQSMGQTKKGEMFTMKEFLKWKRLAPIAACLIIVVAITAVFGNNAGWFDGKTYTAEIGEGTLTFYKKNFGTGSMAFELGIDGTARDLTAEENTLLFGEAFGEYTISSHGFFSIGDTYGPDKSLLHVEARAMNDGDNYDGGMKIILAASSLGYISDTLIETSRKVSEVNGVQVSAGYWITRANSRSERNIIYLASYETNGVTVYIECGGSLERSDEIKERISSVIETLINSETPTNIPFVYFVGDKPQQIGRYVTENASVLLYEDNKFVLHGPAEISHTPGGTYTIENGTLTLYGAGEQMHKFIVDGDTIVFESGDWLENWVEPGTVLEMIEPN